MAAIYFLNLLFIKILSTKHTLVIVQLQVMQLPLVRTTTQKTTIWPKGLSHRMIKEYVKLLCRAIYIGSLIIVNITELPLNHCQ